MGLAAGLLACRVGCGRAVVGLAEGGRLMATEYRCDICYRQTHEGDFGKLAYTTPSGSTEEFLLCGPRDGMDVGCVGRVRAMVGFGQQQAHDWLQAKRPESLRSGGYVRQPNGSLKQVVS